MINIKSSFLNCLSPDEILSLSYPDLLKEEQDFCITVNGNMFFEQPLFPILEFLHSYLKWKISLNSKKKFSKQKHDFYYNSIETEDNPLISFKKDKSGWKLDSPWKNFECEDVFLLEDFICACDKLISQTTD